MEIHVSYYAKPGRREEFLRKLSTEGIIDAIRRERGCLRYDYYLSCQNENEILLLEQWESEDAQRIHMQQPHMQKLAAIKADCIAQTDIRKL